MNNIIIAIYNIIYIQLFVHRCCCEEAWLLLGQELQNTGQQATPRPVSRLLRM